MKQAIFVGAMAGLVVSFILGWVALLKDARQENENMEQTFRAACAKVNGTAVWNRKYWECLK